MTTTTDEELDALVNLTEEFVTATWHLLDNSETSGPKDDPTITVWQHNFDEVSALLDRCEGLPSGSMEHMAAGELLAANLISAITALRAQLADANARADRAEAAKDVLAERQRQISTEGWTPEHDDTHINGEMAQAAACYTLNAAGWKTEALRGCWPMAWASAWFKPADQRRDLVKAGALILAEIERLDRAALRAIGESSNESA